MKKLIIVIFIIVLLPVVSFSESEPILGAYYLFYDSNATPELASSYGEGDYAMSIYFFQADGTIMGIESEIDNGNAETQYSVQGKWEKDDYAYKYSLIGIGSGKLTIADNGIYISLSNGLKLLFRKLFPFDPYNDYKRE